MPFRSAVLGSTRVYIYLWIRTIRRINEGTARGKTPLSLRHICFYAFSFILLFHYLSYSFSWHHLCPRSNPIRIYPSTAVFCDTHSSSQHMATLDHVPKPQTFRRFPLHPLFKRHRREALLQFKTRNATGRYGINVKIRNMVPELAVELLFQIWTACRNWRFYKTLGNKVCCSFYTKKREGDDHGNYGCDSISHGHLHITVIVLKVST